MKCYDRGNLAPQCCNVMHCMKLECAYALERSCLLPAPMPKRTKQQQDAQQQPGATSAAKRRRAVATAAAESTSDSEARGNSDQPAAGRRRAAAAAAGQAESDVSLEVASDHESDDEYDPPEQGAHMQNAGGQVVTSPIPFVVVPCCNRMLLPSTPISPLWCPSLSLAAAELAWRSQDETGGRLDVPRSSQRTAARRRPKQAH